MAIRRCLVSLTDLAGVRHTVEVSAESLFEAAALGMAAIRREQWTGEAAQGTPLEVAVVEPVVKHTVSVQQIERWLDGVTKSPGERLKKDRLKAMLK